MIVDSFGSDNIISSLYLASILEFSHLLEIILIHAFPKANAMGRIGGITCPFIISRDNSLRTIGLVMFFIGIMTSVFTWCLPETAGMALGNFDNSATEQQPHRTVLQEEEMAIINSTCIRDMREEASDVKDVASSEIT
jgi:hypothetical protein